MQENPPLQPWQWPEQHWRGLVERVRAGRRLRPSSWKDGARCAIALSFDCDHETNELRDGGKSIGRLSWGQYGSLVGIPRILDVLHRHDVRATFFVPGVTATLYPDEQRRIAAEGHEIGMHGWIHEIASALPIEAERELMLRTADAIENASGARPIGLRTPSFEIGPNTLRIARELGIRHDSSLMAHEDCYEILLDGEPCGIVELPADWVRDDGAYLWTERFGGLRPYTHPSQVFDIFRRELDAAFDEGGLFQLIMHPHVIGYRSRIDILEEIIKHARSRGSVWVGTHGEITDWARRSGS
jgi:peptidoglycan-N-acetylglucosamine deacetylase